MKKRRKLLVTWGKTYEGNYSSMCIPQMALKSVEKASPKLKNTANHLQISAGIDIYEQIKL